MEGGLPNRTTRVEAILQGLFTSVAGRFCLSFMGVILEQHVGQILAISNLFPRQ